MARDKIKYKLYVKCYSLEIRTVVRDKRKISDSIRGLVICFMIFNPKIYY